MPDPTPAAGRDDLRDQIADALHERCPTRPYGERCQCTTYADAVLAELRPELDRLREAADRERRATDTAHWHLNHVTKDRLKWEQEAVAQHHRSEQAEAAVERARELARHPRTSMGRVNGYVLAADVLAAIDPPVKEGA